MSTQHFNATTELEDIRHYRNIRKHKTYHLSRLAKCRAELVAMRKQGGSYRELALWLEKKKRMKVTHTTVMRYLAKLPELKEGNIKDNDDLVLQENSDAELS